MPVLDVSELNIVLGVLGGFIILYGIIAQKIKGVWYLGEACMFSLSLSLSLSLTHTHTHTILSKISSLWDKS
jgi:hypothetical protein